MRFTMLSIVAASILWLLPVEASAIVWWNRVETPPDSPYWPDGLAEALESQPFSHGGEFWGWGQHSITLYYEGDAREFQSFVTALQSMETIAIIKSSVIPHGLKPHGAIPDEDIPKSREPTLGLAPGQGKHVATGFGLKENFEYDWRVVVTHTFNDDPSGSFVTAVLDQQGQTVQRTIARRPEFVPRLTIGVTRHVGDGAALSEMDLPSDWLLGHDPARTSSRSIYLPPPGPDEIDKDTLLGSERIERYLARERRERQQAEAAWRIREFYGITIDLDGDALEAPTIIASYHESRARFDVETGKPLTADETFPKTATSLVEQWLGQERAAVVEQWKRAKNGEPIGMVESLE